MTSSKRSITAAFGKPPPSSKVLRPFIDSNSSNKPNINQDRIRLRQSFLTVTSSSSFNDPHSDIHDVKGNIDSTNNSTDVVHDNTNHIINYTTSPPLGVSISLAAPKFQSKSPSDAINDTMKTSQSTPIQLLHSQNSLFHQRIVSPPQNLNGMNLNRSLVGSQNQVEYEGTRPNPIKKIFNDPIHDNIQLDEITVRIIDTPEFQRLDKLKQLGTCQFVFRGATHTRFEHSIGVSYLSEKFAKRLQENQPELDITPVDVLCVKIAGLCHDLGHGPFSHVYDNVYIPSIHKKRGKPNTWKHEDGSVSMLRLLLENNHIRLEEYGIKSNDILFIEEIIRGVKEQDRKGRDPHKFYLYDIVNNMRSGLDMDKIDYFQRDMKYTNVIMNASFERFIQLAKVLPSQPLPSSLLPYPDYMPLMICYPEKLVREATDLFRIRFRMHGSVYQHKAVKQVEYMLTDALELAEDYISIKGKVTPEHPDGLYKISECIDDITALSNLNDSIIEIMSYDSRPELKPAQDIIKRIKTRQLYVNVGKTAYIRGDHIDFMTEEAIISELVSISEQIALHCTNQHYSINNMEISSNGNSDVNINYSEDMTYYDDGSNVTMSGFSEEEEGEDGKDHVDYLHTPDEEFSTSSVTQEGTHSTQSSIPILKASDVIVEKMSIHYGLKSQNPVSRMRFFAKTAPLTSNSAKFQTILSINGLPSASGTVSSSSSASTSAFGHINTLAMSQASFHNSVYLSQASQVTGNGGTSLIGRELDESVYETELPRVFEENAVRVFCRSLDKEIVAITRLSFMQWCQSKNKHPPFPSLSQTDAVDSLNRPPYNQHGYSNSPFDSPL